MRHCYQCTYGAPLDGAPLLTFPLYVGVFCPSRCPSLARYPSPPAPAPPPPMTPRTRRPPRPLCRRSRCRSTRRRRPASTRRGGPSTSSSSDRPHLAVATAFCFAERLCLHRPSPVQPGRRPSLPGPCAGAPPLSSSPSFAPCLIELTRQVLGYVLNFGAVVCVSEWAVLCIGVWCFLVRLGSLHLLTFLYKQSCLLFLFALSNAIHSHGLSKVNILSTTCCKTWSALACSFLYAIPVVCLLGTYKGAISQP